MHAHILSLTLRVPKVGERFIAHSLSSFRTKDDQCKCVVVIACFLRSTSQLSKPQLLKSACYLGTLTYLVLVIVYLTPCDFVIVHCILCDFDPTYLPTVTFGTVHRPHCDYDLFTLHSAAPTLCDFDAVHLTLCSPYPL